MSFPDELISFAEQNPWGVGWPPGMVQHLVRLVSSENLVLQKFENGERAAAALLIDRVQNPGNLASLEVLGMRAGLDQKVVLTELVEAARKVLPQNRSGFELSLPDTTIDAGEFAIHAGLEPYYETFGMVNEAPLAAPSPPPGVCTIVTDRDEEELYRVLVQCLSENVDTSIPSFEDWRANRRAPSRSKTWGVWKDKQLVAFCHLSIPHELPVAEIRTLGVLPEFRRQGLAKALILRALNFTAQLEIPRCLLTVAVRNRDALSLYRGLGFRELDHRSVYRWLR